MTDDVNLGKFIQGKNNVAKETSLPEGSLRDAINVDIDNSGNIRKREGYSLLYSGNNIDSLFNRYFREDNSLKKLNDDNTATTLASGLEGAISYAEFNDKIYATDTDSIFIIDNMAFYPATIPTPDIIGHDPVDGEVQTTYAYRDQITGEIGGAPLAQSGATSFSKIGYDLVEYNSTGDDGRLYDVAGNICQTQFMEPLPAGQIIEYYKGKLYVAEDSTLWYSEPHRYGLTKRSTNFFSFPNRITICLAVDHGIYVVADKTYFITFSKTEEATIKEILQTTAVEGTGIKVSGADMGFEMESEVAYWFSSEGAVVGLPNGQVQNLSDDALAVPDNTSYVGTSMYKEYNGIKQILTSMPLGGEVSTLQSIDSANLTVIRNGVIV